MILYNVTVAIDPSVEKEWVNWMRSVHIPDVMATGCFIESRFSKVQTEDEEGLSYAITYLCPNKDMLEKYRNNYAPELQKDHSEKFNGRFAAFRTLLDVIEEFK
jgi:hypothetical protein